MCSPLLLRRQPVYRTQLPAPEQQVPRIAQRRRGGPRACAVAPCCRRAATTATRVNGVGLLARERPRQVCEGGFRAIGWCGEWVTLAAPPSCSARCCTWGQVDPAVHLAALVTRALVPAPALLRKLVTHADPFQFSWGCRRSHRYGSSLLAVPVPRRVVGDYHVGLLVPRHWLAPLHAQVFAPLHARRECVTERLA